MKPCPFCGWHEAMAHTVPEIGRANRSVSFVVCLGCASTGPSLHTPADSPMTDQEKHDYVKALWDRRS